MDLVYEAMRFMLTVLALVLVSAPAFAQAEADLVAILSASQVYVEDGAERVDISRLQESVGRAADLDLDLRIAVLADEGDAESTAVSLRDALGGVTVVVFTADQFGVASAEVSSDRLGDALEAAGEALAGESIEDGVGAFVQALEPGPGFPWGWVVAVVVAGVLVLAFGGRFWDSKARAERQARRIARWKSELRERASAISDEVLDLSDRVELADSVALSTRYRDAVAEVRDVEAIIEDAEGAHDLDDVESRISELEELFRRIRADVEQGTASR